MHKEDFDVVVVGGSFAGLACAQSAASRGLRTLVLERKVWPGTRVHTTGIVVKELADTWPIPSRLSRRIDGVRLYSPALDSIDLASPDYYFLATDTPGLMRWHAQQAIQAGAAIRFNSAFADARRCTDRLWLVNRSVRTRFLAGCDGARSRTARALGLGRNARFLVGVEAEIPFQEGISETHLHVFLDSRLARGYIAWIVPGTAGLQVGLACRHPGKPNFGRFMQVIGRRFGVHGARPKRFRAGFIPCGGVVKPYFERGALLLGDAAGMVSPLTAGGIHLAVQIGGVAGGLIADRLLEGGPEPGAMLRAFLPRFRYKGLLRLLFDTLPPPNGVYDRLLRTEPFTLFAQTLFFHHRGLLSAAAWRDFLRLLYGH